MDVADRHGRWVLLAIFIALLGGMYTLDRISAGLPHWAVRWPFFAICALAAWAWLLFEGERLKELRRVLPLGAGLKWFLVWMAYLAISSLWARPDARVGAWLADVAGLTGFVLLTHLVASRLSPRALASVYTWFLVVALIYLVDALAIGPAGNGRYASFQGGPNIFVRVMVLGALGALYIAIRHRRTWALFLAPICLVGAVLSGSRGGLIALVGAIVIAGFPLARRIPLRSGLALLAAVVLVIVFFHAQVGAALGGTDVYQRFVVETFKQHYDANRGSIFQSAWDVGVHNPIIGAGLDGYWAEYGSAHAVLYAHNLVLQSFSDGGIIGVLLLLGVLGAWLLEIRKCRPLNPEARIALVVGIYVFFASMFSGDYYDSRFVWFALVIASAQARRARLDRSTAAEGEADTAGQDDGSAGREGGLSTPAPMGSA